LLTNDITRARLYTILLHVYIEKLRRRSSIHLLPLQYETVRLGRVRFRPQLFPVERLVE
jgi:hypothetical protein